MKPKTKIVISNGRYTVQFCIFNQIFNLAHTTGNSRENKDVALWMKDMLDKAFEKLEEETKKES